MKMYQVLRLIILAIPGLIAAESEADTALFKRLEATERLVQNLFDEVASLKAQDNIHKEHISDLKKQLDLQQHRSNHLVKLNRKLTANKLKPRPLKEKLVHLTNESAKVQDPETGINRIRRVENETPVAFFAMMATQMEHVGMYQNLKFENVKTNIGAGFHNHLGTFIAPVSGTYVFSTTLLSCRHAAGRAHFAMNGNLLTSLTVSLQPDYDTASQTVVLQLKAGDDLSIQNSGVDMCYYAGGYTCFSGFLLFEDYPSSPTFVAVGK